MDAVYSVAFPLIAIAFVLMDYARLRQHTLGIRSVYYGLVAVTMAIYAARQFHLTVPMPTRFFVNYVSPAVEAILGLR